MEAGMAQNLLSDTTIRSVKPGDPRKRLSDGDGLYLLLFVRGRDPNGYVIELCAKRPGHDDAMDPATNGAREKLERWTQAKGAQPR